MLHTIIYQLLKYELARVSLACLLILLHYAALLSRWKDAVRLPDAVRPQVGWDASRRWSIFKSSRTRLSTKVLQYDSLK